MTESVPNSERAVDINLNLLSEQLLIDRVFGVQWSVELDCFGFSIILKDQPLTRRGVLLTVASVYDPLGPKSKEESPRSMPEGHQLG